MTRNHMYNSESPCSDPQSPVGFSVIGVRYGTTEQYSKGVSRQGNGDKTDSAAAVPYLGPVSR